MEWKMEWNGTEISVWNMEDARMEWNGRFLEWNGRQSSILSYKFHTRFWAFFTEKYTPMSGGDKKYCHKNNQLQYLRVLFVDKLRYLGRLYCENSVLIASLQAHCSLQHWCYSWRLWQVLHFFLRFTICPILNFVFLHRHENSYLLFHSRFSLILFLFLVFQLTIILFGVKAWYFYNGKCYLAVWLWQILLLIWEQTCTVIIKQKT